VGGKSIVLLLLFGTSAKRQRKNCAGSHAKILSFQLWTEGGGREYTFGLKDKNATIYYYNLQIVKHVTIYFIFFSQEILLI
jgi:hypothetical protein